MNKPARIAATTVFVIATLAAGRAITDVFPTDTLARGGADPFVVQGAVGKPADLRYAEITVERVRPALGVKAVSAIDTTTAHLVVVDLLVKAKKEDLYVSGLNLLTPDGRRYSWDRRFMHRSAPVGMDWYLSAVFEVPADAIEGAMLQVSPGADWWEQRRDHLLEVDLDLDAGDAEEFAASRDIIESPGDGLEPPVLEPSGQVGS